MKPIIYHLIGTPAAGKYTIGSIVAERTGARFIDNHSITNVIFNVFGSDGVTPLPDGVWSYVGRVREATMDALEALAPPHLSFVFTNYLIGQDPKERLVFDQLQALAERRKSVFVPVLLRCDTAELMARAANDSRVQRMKLIDPLAIARFNDEFPQFETDHPNAFKLDVTRTPPEESAARIIEWATRVQNAAS
jgi:hypothetical protein